MTKFLFLLIILLSCHAFAEKKSAIEMFEKGINSYKQKNFEESKEYFLNSLKDQPESTSTLYNLGLTEYKLGQLGRASAYWKKTIFLDPSHIGARKSLRLVEKKIPSSTKNSFWEKLRTGLLSHFTLQSAAVFFTLFLTGCLASLIKHFTRRYIAVKNHLPMPIISKIMVFFTASFFFFCIIFFSKLYDHTHPRGVVVSDLTGLFLSPTTEDIKISELSQGAELIVKNSNNEWVQVKTLNNNFGWIKKEDFFQTSGASIQ